MSGRCMTMSDSRIFQLRELIGGACLALLLVVLVLWAIHSAETTPDMRLTWPSGECVAVIPETAGTCDDPPERFNTVWVME